MQPIPGEVIGLLKEVRAHLANSSDPWERRREFIVAINQHVEGGEADLFVGTVREMSRIGATYANLIQTLAQMNTGPDAAARLSQLMAGTMPTAAFLMPGPFNPAAFGMPGAQNPFTARPPMAPFGAPASAPTGNAAAIPGMDYLRMVADFMSAQATSLKAASAVAGCGPTTAGDSAAEAPPTA
jgi:hypothetical protein